MLAAASFITLWAAGMPVHLRAQRAQPPQPTATDGGSTPPTPRRLTGEEIDAINRKDPGTPTVLDLRPLRSGESQVLGHLTRIDCVTGAVRVYVKTGTETLMAAAPKLQSIELRTYRGDKEFMLGCGARPASDRVYLTWRSASSSTAAPRGRQAAPASARESNPTARHVGTAVALEFLPADYVPPETAK